MDKKLIKNALLWETLSSFSRKELKEFHIFLESPFFNTRKDVIKLCHYLSDRKHIANTNPTKEKAFYYVFENEPYNDQKMRLTISRLNKVVEQYLTVKEMQHAPFEFEKMLISAFRRRGLNHNFQKTLNNSIKNIDKQKLRNTDYYDTKFFFEYQNYLKASEKKRTTPFNLKEIDQNLNFSFFSKKLRQASLSLSHQTVTGDEYLLPLLDEVLQMATQKPYKDIPAISVYYHFITLFQPDKAIQFEKFKEELFLNIKHFSKEEFRDLYLAAINFCIRKLNNNEKKYLYEALDLYKKGLELDLLIENGKLSRFTYNNIVGIAIKIDNPEWIEKFITTYQQYLTAPHHIPTYNFSMARLEFARKNYKKSLIFLQRADYEDIINNMTAKLLQMKIYYELNEYEALFALLKSMKAFINRKKKISYHFKLWKNTIHYVQKLVTVNPYDSKAVANLKSDIQNEEILVEKEWMLEKLKNNR